MIKRALWQGLIAGTAGGIVMTLGEKLEQAITKRPDSHVPARVLQRLTGMAEHPGKQPVLVNWAMHFGQAALLGVLRSVMAQAGLRGPVASAKFTVVRLTNDQILENATGVGAPPPTWPRKELVIDVLHKAVYAFATGVVADALAARSVGSGPGQRHAAVRPGRHADVGPLPERTPSAGRTGSVLDRGSSGSHRRQHRPPAAPARKQIDRSAATRHAMAINHTDALDLPTLRL